MASYDSFLETNFDTSNNYVNPVSHSASITDDESCALNEMKKQPDRVHFEEAMVKEMKTMLDNEIIETVPRQ